MEAGHEGEGGQRAVRRLATVGKAVGEQETAVKKTGAAAVGVTVGA